MGRVGVISTAAAFLAGYNLRLLTVVQAMSQLDAVYGDKEARTFATNHGLQILFAPREQRDADEYSAMLGHFTERATSRGRSRSFGRTAINTVSRNESDQRRALLLPQEFKEIGAERLVVVAENCKPILAEKIRYHRDPAFRVRLRPAPIPRCDGPAPRQDAAALEAKSGDQLGGRPRPRARAPGARTSATCRIYRRTSRRPKPRSTRSLAAFFSGARALAITANLEPEACGDRHRAARERTRPPILQSRRHFHDSSLLESPPSARRAPCSSPPRPPTVDPSQKAPGQRAPQRSNCRGSTGSSQSTLAARTARKRPTDAHELQPSGRPAASAPAGECSRARGARRLHDPVPVRRHTRRTVGSARRASPASRARRAAHRAARTHRRQRRVGGREPRRTRARRGGSRLSRERRDPPAQIRTTWQPVGDPAADNTTTAGRALNRRVEVELYRVAPRAATWGEADPA